MPIDIRRKLHLEISFKSIEQATPKLKQALQTDFETEPEVARDVELASTIREIIASAIDSTAKANPESICNLVEDVCINWELTE